MPPDTIPPRVPPEITPSGIPLDTPARSAAAHARLDALWARGTAFLGCQYAIMGGAMSWVSERHLVAAISNAGGFGVDRLRRNDPRPAGRRDRRHPGAH